MLRLICVSALAGLLAVAPAWSQTVPVPDRQLLVGKYYFEEEGIAVDVSLNADSTAVYNVGGSVGIRVEGTWDVRGERIHIVNKPGPVKSELAGTPTPDPSVALRVVAQLPDGSSAEGLAVTWPNAAGLFYMSDGNNETRLEEGPVLGAANEGIGREGGCVGVRTGQCVGDAETRSEIRLRERRHFVVAYSQGNGGS